VRAPVYVCVCVCVRALRVIFNTFTKASHLYTDQFNHIHYVFILFFSSFTRSLVLIIIIISVVDNNKNVAI